LDQSARQISRVDLFYKPVHLSHGVADLKQIGLTAGQMNARRTLTAEYE
jgi:hypothetical protein